jgi:hypothetical protein
MALTCGFMRHRERFCALRLYSVPLFLTWYMVYALQGLLMRGTWQVNDTGGQSQDLAVGVTPRCRGVGAVIIALTAAFAFGAIDQYLGAGASSFAIQVSGGMSALWLLVPFLAGAWQAGQRRAALVGLAATWLSILAYVLMIVSPMEGTHLGPRPAGLVGSWNQLSLHLFLMVLASQWPWFAGGLITGPLYGWLGHRWRSGPSRPAALLAALPVVLEPAGRWLATRLGLGSIPWIRFSWPGDGPAVTAEFAELAVGLLLTGAAVRAVARDRAAGRV